MKSGTLRGIPSAIGVALAAGACSSGQESLVSYTIFTEPGFAPEGIVIEVSDGANAWRLSGDAFTRRTSGRWDTGDLETRTAGELQTSFWLIQGADTLSSGQLELDLRADWSWNVGFHREDRDPSQTCFGCVGAMPYELAAELQTAPADSLWLVWGGNSISDPVIF